MTNVEERLLRVLRRFIRNDDTALSDAEFVRTVYSRFEKERSEPIIDVNE